MSEPLWHKNAVFYECYVRAFCDSNGDGHGDLKGLTARLDYLQELGVDCLWLLPIYPSPLLDDGYDIADYYGMLEQYGTLDDFRQLVSAVHARGMHIIADLVLNHTSDQHPWFQAARADRSSPYRDYYVWSDSDQKYAEARDHLPGYREIQLGLGRAGRPVLLASFLCFPARLELRQSSRARRDAPRHAVLARPGD